MKYFVTFPSVKRRPSTSRTCPPARSAMKMDGATFLADAVVAPGGATSIRVDGKMVDLWMEGAPPDVGVVAAGRRFYAKVESERMRALAAAAGGKSGGKSDGVITSPCPAVSSRSSCRRATPSGTPLIVVEAMKMENEALRRQPGTVAKVVTPGTNVEGGAKLIEIRA
ncbi:MAG: biotin/lipoyl-containing protein [Polyangiaceae bacterium]